MKKYIRYSIFITYLVCCLINAFGQQVNFLRPQGIYTEYKDTENMYNFTTQPRGSMYDLLVNVLSSGNLGTGSFDFFDFFRDSYPLPGGK